jgi:hypothetical protein
MVIKMSNLIKDLKEKYIPKKWRGKKALREGHQRWAKQKWASPAPNFVKWAVFMRYAQPNSIWVETGTYKGDTTNYLRTIGSTVYTIEPSEILFNNAVQRFKKYQNVSVLNEISETAFPKLLPTLSGSINFWLDGHYSSGITHLGPNETPIEQELLEIEKNIKNFSKISIFIDDVRCFSPHLIEFKNYPKLKYLVDWAEKNSLIWTIEHDIFIMKLD